MKGDRSFCSQLFTQKSVQIMITLAKLFQKGFGNIAVRLALSIPIVLLNAQSSFAIPLEPILDLLGRNALESLLGNGFSAQPLPANQQVTNTTEVAGSPGTYPAVEPSPNYLPPNYQQPSYPNYSPPNYQQPTYPNYPPPNYQQPTYPGYLPPNYQQPTYPNYPPPNYQQPSYPGYPPPNYQQPSYPNYSPPNYQPPIYFIYPPARSSPPVIINNF
jgi:hypothetical protein